MLFAPGDGEGDGVDAFTLGDGHDGFGVGDGAVVNEAARHFLLADWAVEVFGETCAVWFCSVVVFAGEDSAAEW